MHNSIKMTTPCEFINLTPVNPLISHCQIKVCYVGDEPNRNKSVITKKVAREMANSLPGSPIVGYYNEDKGDFEEHNRVIDISNGKFQIKDTTRPYGFVDLSAKCWFQKFLDDGVEHEYLMTEGYLWTGQYPEANRIIERGNNQSMELDEKLIDAEWSKNSNGEPQFFIINEAIISKLCILGEDVEPCFEGAQISKVQFSLDDDFKQRLFSMMEQMMEILNEGGAPVEDEKVIETPITEEPEVVEEVVEEVEDTVVVEETIEEVATEEETPVVEEESPVDEPAEAAAEEGKEAPVVEFSEEEKEDEEEEKCPKCGKPESECQCNEDEEDKKDKYCLEEIQEYVELSNRYSELESKFNDLESKYNSMEADYNELVSFKKSAEMKEKQAMIDSFYMLSEEDKKEVQENIENYSLDDIEAKLSIICVRNKVSFDLEDDKPAEGQTNPTTYNLTEVEIESVPAWIKAVQSVAKKNK